MVPELRAAHVQRHAWDREELVFYASRNPDLGDSPLPDYCIRVTPSSIWAAIRDRRPSVLELPEPLWLRALPLTVAAARAAPPGTRRVAYCIENNSLRELLTLRGRSVVKPGTAALRRLIPATYDRLAFGTPGSAAAYSPLLSGTDVTTSTFLELGSASSEATRSDPTRVLFVGRMEERKGIIDLISAWPSIEAKTGASLTLVGDGPLANTVREFTEAQTDRRRYIRHIPHADMPNLYRDHRVLVAPSRRHGRWREQVGLPIKESLRYGLTVVTTGETGLAPWLEAEGHFVVNGSQKLADVVVRAIAAPLSVAVVTEALPKTDGRKAAHEWLRTE